jgi:hypothetical protein
MTVDRLYQTLQTRDHGIVVDPQLEGATFASRIHVRCLGKETTDAPSRPGL